ncbi:protein networked 3a-related [Anaeramoeba flamelloides]|uniref:Protein networked 3a-related n=1 Tax=Anaeramoeba flamelloides TaxID=1746091 RepID=A0AAV7ZN10_9EUKA|nr:protein networked 3a-related [Anaeramoeba flamelloides]
MVMSTKNGQLHVLEWMSVLLQKQISITKDPPEQLLLDCCQVLKQLENSLNFDSQENNTKENLNLFLLACQKYGVPSHEVLSSRVDSKLTNRGLLQIMEAVGLISEKKSQKPFFSTRSPPKVQKSKVRFQNKSETGFNNLIREEFHKIKQLCSTMTPMKKNDTAWKKEWSKSPYLTLHRTLDPGFKLSPNTYQQPKYFEKRIQQYYAIGRVEFSLQLVRQQKHTNQLENVILRLNRSEFSIDVKENGSYQYRYSKVLNSKIRLSQNDPNLFQLVIYENKVRKETEQEKEKEKEKEKKKETEKENERDKETEKEKEIEKEKEKVLEINKENQEIKKEKEIIKPVLELKLISKNTEERNLISKTFQMFKNYYGESPEFNHISGYILGTKNEIMSISLRCLCQGEAIFRVKMINKNNRKLDWFVLKIQKECFLIQKVNSMINNQNIGLKPLTIYWDENYIQTALSGKKNKKKYLLIIIQDNIQAKILRLACRNKNERDLIQNCLTIFENNSTTGSGSSSELVLRQGIEEQRKEEEQNNFDELLIQGSSIEKKIKINKSNEPSTSKLNQFLLPMKKHFLSISAIDIKQASYFSIFDNRGNGTLLNQKLISPFSIEACCQSPLITFQNEKQDLKKWLINQLNKITKDNKTKKFELDLITFQIPQNDISYEDSGFLNGIYLNKNNDNIKNNGDGGEIINDKQKVDPNELGEKCIDNNNYNKITENFTRKKIFFIFTSGGVEIREKNEKENLILKENYSNKQKIFFHPIDLKKILFINNNGLKYILSISTILIKNLFINCFVNFKDYYLKKKLKIKKNGQTKISRQKYIMEIKILCPIENLYNHKESKNQNISKYICSKYKDRNTMNYVKFEINVHNNIEEYLGRGEMYLFQDHFSIQFSGRLIVERLYSPYSKPILFDKKSCYLRFNVDEYEFLNISFDNGQTRDQFFKTFRSRCLNRIQQILPKSSLYQALILQYNGQQITSQIILKFDCFIIKNEIGHLILDYLPGTKCILSRVAKDLIKLQLGNGYPEIKCLFPNILSAEDFIHTFEKCQSRWLTCSHYIFENCSTFQGILLPKNVKTQIILSNSHITLIKYKKRITIERYLLQRSLIFYNTAKDSIFHLKTNTGFLYNFDLPNKHIRDQFFYMLTNFTRKKNKNLKTLSFNEKRMVVRNLSISKIEQLLYSKLINNYNQNMNLSKNNFLFESFYIQFIDKKKLNLVNHQAIIQIYQNFILITKDDGNQNPCLIKNFQINYFPKNYSYLKIKLKKKNTQKQSYLIQFENEKKKLHFFWMVSISKRSNKKTPICLPSNLEFIPESVLIYKNKKIKNFHILYIKLLNSKIILISKNNHLLQYKYSDLRIEIDKKNDNICNIFQNNLLCLIINFNNTNHSFEFCKILTFFKEKTINDKDPTLKNFLQAINRKKNENINHTQLYPHVDQGSDFKINHLNSNFNKINKKISWLSINEKLFQIVFSNVPKKTNQFIFPVIDGLTYEKMNPNNRIKLKNVNLEKILKIEIPNNIIFLVEFTSESRLNCFIKSVKILQLQFIQLLKKNQK